MDWRALRNAIRPVVMSLANTGKHTTLPETCIRLGLPTLPDEGSKAERVKASFDSLPDPNLQVLASRLLEFHPPAAQDRNALQDLLWSDTTAPAIPKKYRREVARARDIHDLYKSFKHFEQLLDRLWILDDDPLELLIGGTRSLRYRIYQHVHRNPGDWSTEELFEELGAFGSSDRRFALFLEGLASSEVLVDEAAQRDFVSAVNQVLLACSVELREVTTEGGYPVFTVVSKQTGSSRSPKNLIFASPEKPDIRFLSAVDNDIEIVSNAEKVLVFDQPIGAEGLRWRDLQAWWAETKGIEDDQEAKRTLYLRMRESLPQTSPPQLRLFESYYSGFRQAVPDLPALLPEVWLHWDPKTVKERGTDALLRFRMDFLLLLPHGTRVVIEVDGREHYSKEDGRADTSRYANMAAADRDLKLSGYDVFRFGGSELQDDSANSTVKTFFIALFKRYSVPLPRAD